MPTDAQMLQAEREGLLSPQEQQGINELRDMGGFPRALGVPGQSETVEPRKLSGPRTTDQPSTTVTATTGPATSPIGGDLATGLVEAGGAHLPSWGRLGPDPAAAHQDPQQALLAALAGAGAGLTLGAGPAASAPSGAVMTRTVPSLGRIAASTPPARALGTVGPPAASLALKLFKYGILPATAYKYLRHVLP